MDFTGGVRVAVGDVNGDTVPDLITGAGVGGGPHVKVYDGSNGDLIRSFLAWEAAYTGGINVAAGDTDGNRHGGDVVQEWGIRQGRHVRGRFVERLDPAGHPCRMPA